MSTINRARAVQISRLCQCVVTLDACISRLANQKYYRWNPPGSKNDD